MILYYPTKFQFNTMNSFRVIGRGHSTPTPHPAQAPKKSPGRIGLTLSGIYATLSQWKCEQIRHKETAYTHPV